MTTKNGLTGSDCLSEDDELSESALSEDRSADSVTGSLHGLDSIA